MEQVTSLLSDVVKKLGGGTLAMVVLVAMFLGAGVYAYSVYTSSQATEAPTGNVDNRTINNSDVINQTGGKEQNVNVSKPISF